MKVLDKLPVAENLGITCLKFLNLSGALGVGNVNCALETPFGVIIFHFSNQLIDIRVFEYLIRILFYFVEVFIVLSFKLFFVYLTFQGNNHGFL